MSFTPPVAQHVAYDVETWMNVFLLTASPLPLENETMWTYEISERRDHSVQLFSALTGGYFSRMYGFNNLGYDWVIVAEFLRWFRSGSPGGWRGCVETLRRKNDEVFASIDRWAHRPKPWLIEVPQVDLYLLHHFDNPNKRTSLKTLEFNMRSHDVQESPVPFDRPVRADEIDGGIAYNVHDVRETKRFAAHSRDMLEFREKLIADSNGEIKLDALSWNDTKIGKKHFARVLEKRQPGICYDENRKPRQTWRTSLKLGDIVLPYIRFERPEFRALLDQVREMVLRTGRTGKLETKGVFAASAIADGFQFDIGNGGIHGSVSRKVFIATRNRPIVDIDVASQYPSIAIVNRLYPAHLGTLFCDVYSELKDERIAAKRLIKSADRDVAHSAAVKADALKFSLNGVYGDSNSAFSVFYDPAYTMSITMNGQLLILMLVEKLMTIPSLELIQVNTDGVTFAVGETWIDSVRAVMDWWQHGTSLELEENRYNRVFVRDVNNYVAEDLDGNVKLKGEAYDYEMKIGKQKQWNKDHSSLVIQKAAVAAMLHDVDVEHFVEDHLQRDPWDFMLRAKVDGQNRLVLDDGQVLQKTVRYYISQTGSKLTKVMPGLKGSPTPRRIGIHAEGLAEAIPIGKQKDGYRCSICGEHFRAKSIDFAEHNSRCHTWKVTIANRYDGHTPADIDLRYYVQQAEKLVLT
jgi:hypothetical protein